MLQSFVVFWADSDSAFDRFPVCVERCFLYSVLVKFHVYGGPVVGIFEDDVNVHRCGEKVGHCGLDGEARTGMGGRTRE